MDTILLQVVTPQGEVFNDEILNILLPGSEGEFGVYPRHTSLLSTLRPGIIKITKKDNTTEAIIVNWGYVKVSETSVRVLIDNAIAIEGDNESVIMKAVADSKELLEKALPNDIMMLSLESQVEAIAKEII
ncbi:ATP synthase epsilon chain [hydrothermal vent metagenome]|uniref:ATP synthase epsilon chain n=1 Tax=hydrothermal vent metagenome TaxID=652676 RepID=A0A3B1E6V0_9ZZZZ